MAWAALEEEEEEETATTKSVCCMVMQFYNFLSICVIPFCILNVIHVLMSDIVHDNLRGITGVMTDMLRQTWRTDDSAYCDGMHRIITNVTVHIGWLHMLYFDLIGYSCPHVDVCYCCALTILRMVFDVILLLEHDVWLLHNNVCFIHDRYDRYFSYPD